MPSIDLFGEDVAHKEFVSAVIRRILADVGVSADVNVRSAVGGHGRAISDLKAYQRAVVKGAMNLTRPDLLVVVIDANCKGLVDARNEVEAQTERAAAGDILVACPDPHVERWFFADPDAFAAIVGVDQRPGRRKCERGFYKDMLAEAVSRAGHVATLGGLEFTWDIVRAMDFHRASRNEPSLGVLIDGVRAFAARAAGE